MTSEFEWKILRKVVSYEWMWHLISISASIGLYHIVDHPEASFAPTDQLMK